MNDLSVYGWTPELDSIWSGSESVGVVPGRVVADHGTSLKVASPSIVTAELSGKLAHYAKREGVPKSGRLGISPSF